MQEPARKPLVIVGAGGHGRVVLDTARAAGLAVAGFIDNSAQRGGRINDCPVLGGNDLLDDPGCLSAHGFIVALGSQSGRRTLSLKIAERGTLASVIHPTAVLSPFAAIGAGTAIIGGVIVNANARVGRFCILNTACTIDHDNDLADGVQVCPGAHLAGTVRCGADVFIGTGAAVIPGVTIGANAVVGAGAVVVRDVPEGAKVVGNPARVREPRRS